ncbi:MAG: hypothetical protein KY410_09550 [Proteobacteria bacterium]|nr:hypothetical protein [Pseudomonadota bacterium]
MPFLLFLLLPLAFTAVSGVAYAADPPGSDENPDDERRGSGELTIIETAAGSRFRSIDSNNDGYVTVPEWAESDIRADFNAVDADGNGIIERNELANHAAYSRTRTQSVDGSPGNQAVRRNTAGAETQDQGGPVADRRVQMMGGNLADGTINFSAYDTDGNGMLDRGEASDNRYVTAYFDAWDVDGNDLLDPGEMKQGSMEVNME